MNATLVVALQSAKRVFGDAQKMHRIQLALRDGQDDRAAILLRVATSVASADRHDRVDGNGYHHGRNAWIAHALPHHWFMLSLEWRSCGCTHPSSFQPYCTDKG